MLQRAQTSGLAGLMAEACPSSLRPSFPVTGGGSGPASSCPSSLATCTLGAVWLYLAPTVLDPSPHSCHLPATVPILLFLPASCQDQKRGLCFPDGGTDWFVLGMTRK